MGLSLSNPERSVQRNKRPHETCSQICNTRTYTILAISPCTSSESAKHELRNALSILTLRNLRSATPVVHLWHHACDTCRSRHDWQLHVLAHPPTHSISAEFPLPTLTHKHARMNSARARKWSRKKLSDTARGRPTEPREHLRIAHLSVNATKLHQKSKFRLILVVRLWG